MPNSTTQATQAHIGAGYKLIDRYQFTEPFETDLAGATGWHAIDYALDRPVSVLLLSGPNAESGAEAARRAALLADSRLTKIIDVGTVEVGDQTRQYIITEPVLGPTLEDLVGELPLDSGTTRTIIGELASALDEADQHGIHHVALRPSSVRINNGRVMLTGLGIDAELGAAHPELGDSEHQDAIGLAALTYYALSGYWPLAAPTGPWRRGDLPALPEAPRDANGLVRPLREMVPDADPVLLELADRALGENPNPVHAPHAVAAHLSPWAPLASGVAAVTAPTVQHAVAPAASPQRKPVFLTNQQPHPRTGRIPKVGKQPISVLPDDEPLHIRPVEVLNQTIAGPQAVVPVVRAPRPPRPKGVPATPIVLGLTLAALLGAGGWAAHSVVSPFLNPEEEHLVIEPDPPQYTAAPGYTADGTPLPAEPAAPVEVHPVVVNGSVIDPYGDGERAENALAAIDGDPSTFWYTYTYSSPQFGGLKPGVGFLLELQEPAPVNSITLHANGHGGNVEVRQTTADDPSGGRMLGSTEFGDERTVDFGGDVEVDSLMLWITGLPQLPDGRYRLELRELTIR